MKLIISYLSLFIVCVLLSLNGRDEADRVCYTMPLYPSSKNLQANFQHLSNNANQQTELRRKVINVIYIMLTPGNEELMGGNQKQELIIITIDNYNDDPFQFFV